MRAFREIIAAFKLLTEILSSQSHQSPKANRRGVDIRAQTSFIMETDSVEQQELPQTMGINRSENP
jgi:hypothetical protein